MLAIIWRQDYFFFEPGFSQSQDLLTTVHAAEPASEFFFNERM